MSDHENYYSSDEDSSIFDEEEEILDIDTLIIPKKISENL